MAYIDYGSELFPDLQLLKDWGNELFREDRTFAEIAINGIVTQLEPIDITE